MRAFNFRRYTRDSLIGFFDLELASGMILRGCTLHDTAGRKWVGLPARPYTNTAGDQTWAPIIEFRDKPTRDSFQRQATAAALAVCGNAKAAA
jgi:hypothetical protein